MSRRDTIACTRWWRRAATYRSHAGNAHSIHRLVGYCVLLTCGRCLVFYFAAHFQEFYRVSILNEHYSFKQCCCYYFKQMCLSVRWFRSVSFTDIVHESMSRTDAVPVALAVTSFSFSRTRSDNFIQDNSACVVRYFANCKTKMES